MTRSLDDKRDGQKRNPSSEVRWLEANPPSRPRGTPAMTDAEGKIPEDVRGIIERLRTYVKPGDLKVGPRMMVDAMEQAADALTAAYERIGELEGVREAWRTAQSSLEEMTEMYEAGKRQWNPVYKIVLDRAEEATAQVAALRALVQDALTEDPEAGWAAWVQKAEAALASPLSGTVDAVRAALVEALTTNGNSPKTYTVIDWCADRLEHVLRGDLMRLGGTKAQQDTIDWLRKKGQTARSALTQPAPSEPPTVKEALDVAQSAVDREMAAEARKGETT